jgi:hypothetical protein
MLLSWTFIVYGDRHWVVDELHRDPGALAQREARRRKFLEEHAAKFARQAEPDRRLRQPVIVARPTMVFFFPGVGAPAEGSPLQMLLRAAADSARAAGWEYTERHAWALRIVDAGAQAIYLAPVARDSFGVALVAPGDPPHVRYGLGALLDLGSRLRALEAWLRAQARPGQVRT